MTVVNRQCTLRQMLIFFGVFYTAEYLRQRGYTLQQAFDIIAVNL